MAIISMAAATLIGSIIAAGSAAVAGGLNARSQRKANPYGNGVDTYTVYGKEYT